jgi:hypothetical protein
MKLEGSCHCRAVHFEVESHTPYPFMRCYCSICRKTAGGGGYAINIMGQAETLHVHGKEHIHTYRARLANETGKLKLSSGRRHFCKHCGSCLWISDPNWPELIHPFASAIDTPLPKSPERYHIMLDFAAPWCEIPKGKKELHFSEYPEDSIESWHKRHNLYKK